MLTEYKYSRSMSTFMSVQIKMLNKCWNGVTYKDIMQENVQSVNYLQTWCLHIAKNKPVFISCTQYTQDAVRKEFKCCFLSLPHLARASQPPFIKRWANVKYNKTASGTRTGGPSVTERQKESTWSGNIWWKFRFEFLLLSGLHHQACRDVSRLS